MKKLLTFFLATVIFILINTNVQASKLNDDIIDGRGMSSEELSEIRESNSDYSIFLTEEQAVQRAAEVKGVTVNEIMKERKSKMDSTVNSDVKESTVSPSSTTCGWVETTTEIPTDRWVYDPELIVIIQACYGGGAKWITRGVEPYLMEFAATDDYPYTGTIKVELMDGHFIYTVNGRFMETGSSSHSITVGGGYGVYSASYTYTGTSSAVYAKTKQIRVRRDVLGY